MNFWKGLALTIMILVQCSMVHAQEDSVLYQRDSVIEIEDPTTHFFQTGEKAANPSKLFLLTRANKLQSLASFLKTIDMQYADYALADLDHDNQKELVISGFTGGAHCCDEITIYKQMSPGKFQYAGRLFGGHTIITKKREFEFSFDESFGYFFTCFACDFADSGDGAPVPLRRITLQYKKGKLVVLPGDKELRQMINDNLGKLGGLPFGKLENEMAMDEGLRKEVAMNLVVYYYSFGKNLSSTEQLFNKYYKYPDAKKVWAAFNKSLLYLKKDNNF